MPLSRNLWRCAVVVLVAAGSVLLFAPAAPARHFEQRANVVQFNIYGMQGESQIYNETVANAVVQSVNGRNPLPLSISLNEVCKHQFDYMLYVLNQTYGYSGIMTQTRGGNLGSAYPAPRDPQNRCSTFGNALLWLGGTTNELYANWYTNQDTKYPARMNFACGHAVFPEYWTCTTHLRASNEGVARLQANEYRSYVDPKRTAGYGVYAAGDYNLNSKTTANQSTLQPWYNSYQEADNAGMGASYGTTASCAAAGSKLDYVFRANPRSISHVAYMFDSPHSDHCWLQMYP